MFVDRAVGIDLGTTNSEVALLDPSERDLIVYEDRFGRRTVPSAVAWDPTEEALLVGRPARRRRGRTPPPVESIKRKMGRDVAVEVGPRSMSPEEVSAAILGELRRAMREHLEARSATEVRVDRAVITVPAYFDAPQVEATRRAGELAGLEVLGILQEPTAAAIYHTWKRQLGDGCFLIYDLGGGTFDVSILRCLAGEYQVLAIDGDNFLGGDDLDRRFAEHLRQDLVERGYALDLRIQEDPADLLRFLRLVHLAQEIKESLSTRDVVHVSQQGVLEDQAGEPVDVDREIGRGDYDAVVSDLVETTLAACERALAQSHAKAGVGIEDIDHVVLVGGSPRVPLVVRRVTDALCARSRSEAPLQDEVDTCVALGAAVHAAQLGGLRLGDDRSLVTVTTPLVGRGDTLRLGLSVEAAPEGAAHLRVARDGSTLASAPLAAVPAEGVRLEVPLGDGPETSVEVALDGPQGQLGSLPLTLYRGDVRPRASALSQPSVIAKDIALEVVRGGRRERKVLLEAGTGLPAEAQHTFFTGDRSGAVVLRLLQNRLPIKTLMLEVGSDLEVGTPVELTLRCDEAMRLEARAEVAGHQLWATLSPAQQETPTAAQVEGLLIRAEQAATSLWGYDAREFRHRVDPLVTGIREVLATDPDKLAALAARLERLLEDFTSDETAGALRPPLHRFEAVLDALRREVYSQPEGTLGMGLEAWQERIDDLDRRGAEAWAQADGGAWRRVYNEAQALLETAGEERFAQVRVDDPLEVQRRLLGTTAWAKRVEHALVEFVPSAAPEVRGLQVAERDRLLELLQKQVLGPLASLPEVTEGDARVARRKVDEIGAHLERIDAGRERLPSLGLVTEGGGG
ncbi:MAG: Hsp70 family protein [Sandaracinaceae bacterium]